MAIEVGFIVNKLYNNNAKSDHIITGDQKEALWHRDHRLTFSEASKTKNQAETSRTGAFQP